jgi:RND family efflux transporter MFP subunit
MFITKSYLKQIRVKRIKVVAIIAVILLTLLTGVVYACSSGATNNESQTYEVKGQNFNIIVSSDGTLDMPNQFDLKFGTMGEVKDILVNEGDDVKEGAILAFLDDTSQVNAIKTQLFSFRSAINSVLSNSGIEVISPTVGKSFEDNPPPPPYVIVNDTRTCDPNTFYNRTFPDLSAPLIMDEAQTDLNMFSDYFNSKQYRDAGLKLAMTYFDIDVCESIISSKIDVSVLAGEKPNDVYEPDGTAGTEPEMKENYARALDYLAKYRERLLDISHLMMIGDYDSLSRELAIARGELLDVHKAVENTVELKGWNYFTFSDIPTSLNFLQSGLRALDKLENPDTQSTGQADDITKDLYLAKQSLTMGSDILKNQVLTYYWGSGFNWQKLQQYNLAVQNAEIALAEAKQNIMNTVIVAPTSGSIVSVDLKKGYPLSAQTYSSSTAVELVDTSEIRFTGNVDEIDILKVKTGQKVNITVDAVPNKVFTGRVKFISPFGQTSGNVIKFPVTIELDPTDVELRGGLNATADIIIYSAENVLLVPLSMIITGPQGSTVMVMNPDTGKPEPRKVVVGQQDLQYAEITEGLKEGDKLVTPPHTQGVGAANRPAATSGSFRMLRQ